MPTLFNKTPLVAELFPLIDPEGRNVAVIISKATYALRPGCSNLVAAPQPLYLADVYEETDKGRTMRVASDLTDHKLATDVLLVAPPGDLRQNPFAGGKIKVQIGSLEFSGTVMPEWPFGPVPRDERPRRRYAGTYDAAWVADRMPLLPADFDYRFNQVAPERQIVAPYLRGDEILRLKGFIKDGEVLETRLPGRIVLVAANASGCYFTRPAVLDTVVLHLQPPLLEMVWRLPILTCQKIEEVRYVWVYYPTLRSYDEVFGAP